MPNVVVVVDLVAAVSLCNGEAQGIVLDTSHSMEIMPLNSRLKRMLDLWKEVRIKILYTFVAYEIIFDNN